MADHKIGKIFVEIDMDPNRFLRSQKTLLKEAKSGATNLEKNFKNLGIKSGATFDLMRAQAQKSFEAIKKSGKATTDDLIRAEKAKTEKIKQLNEQQYGHTTSMLANLKKHWLATTAAIAAAYMAIRKAVRLFKEIITKTLMKFSDFESALVDMGKVSTESMESIRAKILELPPALGDVTQLVKGYYQTISAGIKDPIKAMDMLITAAKAAKAAHLDQSEMIKALTKAMAGYEGKIKTTSEAADLLFTIEKEGQTTVGELVPVIGSLAKVSHTAGISANEMGAALSVITKTAGDTAEAATHYRAVVVALMRNQENMAKATKELGYESATAMIKELGLVGTLKMLQSTSIAAEMGLMKLYGRQEAMIGATEILAEKGKVFNESLDAMREKTGAADKAWQEYKKTLAATWDTFKNTIGKQAILIGEKLAPQISSIIQSTGEWIDKNKEFIAQDLGGVIQGIVNIFEYWVPILQTTIGYWLQFFDIGKQNIPETADTIEMLKGRIKELFTVVNFLTREEEYYKNALKDTTSHTELYRTTLDRLIIDKKATIDLINKLNARIKELKEGHKETKKETDKHKDSLQDLSKVIDETTGLIKLSYEDAFKAAERAAMKAFIEMKEKGKDTAEITADSYMDAFKAAELSSMEAYTKMKKDAETFVEMTTVVAEAIVGLSGLDVDIEYVQEVLTLEEALLAADLALIQLQRDVEKGIEISVKSAIEAKGVSGAFEDFADAVRSSGEDYETKVRDAGTAFVDSMTGGALIVGEMMISIMNAMEQFVTLPIRMFDAGSSLLDAIGTFPEKLMEAAETFVAKLVTLAPQFVASMIAAIGNFGDIATSTWQGMFGTGGTFGAGSYVRGSIGAGVDLLGGGLTPNVGLSQGRTEQVVGILESELGATVDAAAILAEELINAGIITREEVESLSEGLEQMFRTGMAIDVENWDRWVAEVLAGDIANFEQAIADALSAGIADLSNRITTSDEFGLLSDAMQEQITAMFSAENLDLEAINEFMSYWEELTNIWDNVTTSIAEMTGQLSSLESQVLNIHDRFDDWIDDLRELGIAEEVLAGIREQENVAILHLIDTQREAFEANLTSRMARLTFADQPGRLAAYEGTRNFIEAIEQIKEWSDITGEGYEDLIAQTTEVYRLEMEAAIEQSAAAQELQSAVDEWSEVAKSLDKNIFELRTSLASPRNVLERMGTVWDEITALEAQGAKTPEEIQRLQELYNQYLELAQEAYQRPSSEYQAIYDMVIDALTGLQENAESFVSSYELQKETLIAEQMQLLTQEGMAISLEEIATNIMAGIPVDIQLGTENFTITTVIPTASEIADNITMPTIPPIDVAVDWSDEAEASLSAQGTTLISMETILAEIRRNTYQIAINTYWAGAATGLQLYAEKGGIFSGPDTGYLAILHGIEEVRPLNNNYTRGQIGKDYPEININIQINESKSPRETVNEFEGFFRGRGRKMIQKIASGRL